MRVGLGLYVELEPWGYCFFLSLAAPASDKAEAVLDREPFITRSGKHAACRRAAEKCS